MKHRVRIVTRNLAGAPIAGEWIMAAGRPVEFGTPDEATVAGKAHVRGLDSKTVSFDVVRLGGSRRGGGRY